MGETRPAVGDELPSGCQVIEVHINELNQLFNAMDPAPFRERDLDPNAEEYIVSWARELHHDRPIALVVYLDREPATAEAAAMLKDAVYKFFQERARVTRQKLRELFKTGRLSLAIGLLFLAACVLGGDLIANAMDESRFAGIVRESLLIGGWVAMWKPLDTFLYDWWPIRREMRLYDRLGAMPVRIEPHGPHDDASANRIERNRRVAKDVHD